MSTLARADVDHLTLERQPVLGSALLEQALDQIEVLAQERRVTLARPILPPTSQQQPPGQPPEQERPLGPQAGHDSNQRGAFGQTSQHTQPPAGNRAERRAQKKNK